MEPLKCMNTIQQTNNLKQTVQAANVPALVIDYLERKTKRINSITRSRYSVTDIVGCQRKNYYNRLEVEEEEILDDKTVENMWDSVRGEFLHQLSYASRWRELDIEYPVGLRFGRAVTLSGSWIIMYDWKTRTIIDLKTTKFVKWQIQQGFIPRSEHILQLQCYSTIFSRIIPVEELNILYSDMGDIVVYKVQKRDLAGWINLRIQRLEDSLDNHEVPQGEPSGLCKYCRYQTRCYNYGGGLITRGNSYKTLFDAYTLIYLWIGSHTYLLLRLAIL